MELNDYQKLAMRTAQGFKTDENKMMYGCLSLAGETGEVIEPIKKHLYHGHKLYKEELIKELGDCLWSITLLADAIEATLEEIAERNIEKLKNRYPQGFTQKDSIERKE